ncbi:hypothetical protein LEAN103870_19475 [Legionella anisa]|uniref:Coiled-coil protein n=1 Tax=Legionella anisa TaxID=28082 RepID=A0AAX0WPD5_9GAMM|nr:hypothetical protein [Legionella anisa]AWN73025.1 hypothetical protein DLD14_03760 [Legionella anisa]KTC69961.1 hypothetical protein Lani_2462 [Legionella anisa]MCW8423844.1 hypothetical protein [Legionella anisa]MCW8447365.1 hypothetical protein [Legionella anisa]PNL60144.1 hypothetical protein A6J39_002355 [Legionella anisa]
MTPLLRHLHEIFPELSLAQAESPLNWTFTETIKKLGPDFYRRIIPMHLVMNLEYSLLGRQLRDKFLSPKTLDRDELREQLIAALMMAELLEHIYQYYMDIPREVLRLRAQQNLYRELLAELIPNFPKKPKELPENLSFTQELRNTILDVNLWRLFIVRSKRALDLFALVHTESKSYLRFVKIMDTAMDPFLMHLAWLFWLPRLAVNFYSLLKHTIPGWWMDEHEQSLGWMVRFSAQIKRRYFEFGNDLVWAGAGLINTFYLTGALAPFAFYVSLAVFAFDVIWAMTRAYIELSRLKELRSQYEAMRDRAESWKEQKQIREQLEAIDNQIAFEQFRLGSHVATTVFIFIGMCMALPIFAVNPILPFLGALILVSICLINFALTEEVANRRPRDTLDRSTALSKLGLFSTKEPSPVDLDENEEEDMDLDTALCCI